MNTLFSRLKLVLWVLVLASSALNSVVKDSGDGASPPLICEDWIKESHEFYCGTDHPSETFHRRPFPQFEVTVLARSKKNIIGFIAQMSIFEDVKVRDAMARSLRLQQEAKSDMVDPIHEIYTPGSRLVIVREHFVVYNRIFRTSLVSMDEANVDTYINKIIFPTMAVLRSLHNQGLGLVAWEYAMPPHDFKKDFRIGSGFCFQKLGAPLVACGMDPTLVDPRALDPKEDSKVDQALDYYVLGIYTYQILHNNETPFFGANDLEILGLKQKGTYQFSAKVNTGLALFVAFCLQKNIKNRQNDINLDRILSAVMSSKTKFQLAEDLTINTEDDPMKIPAFQEVLKALDLVGEIDGDDDDKGLVEQVIPEKFPKWGWLLIAAGVAIILVVIAYFACRPKDRETGGRPKDPIIPDFKIAGEPKQPPADDQNETKIELQD